jgi:type IV secretory pathway ATPase VirB11/archaellum biosynthesis ATPase
MLSKKDSLFATELKREAGENVLYINFIGANFVPSLASSPEVMARTIDLLGENSGVSRVVFVQQRNYSFSIKQIGMLVEVANFYNFLFNNERVLAEEKIMLFKDPYRAYSFLSNLLVNLLKQDPVQAYRVLKDEIHRAAGPENEFYKGFLENLFVQFGRLSLIRELVPLMERPELKGREIYSNIFRPDIIPNFTFTRAILKISDECEIIEEYDIGSGSDKTHVSILKEPGDSKPVYHLSSPEYYLHDDYHLLLSSAREVLAEHRPTDEEFNDLERTRRVFFNVARGLLVDLSKNRNISVKYSDLDLLARILVRHTIGFGILEIFLQDSDLQDIMINAPSSKSPIFVRHGRFGECISNIVVSQEDVDSWASKFRMLSGRPLDEAHPVLDTSLSLDNLSARVAIVQQPLSPEGVAYTVRRHRDRPWTLPLFIKNKMIDGLSAGLLSFLIDGSRTMLIAGTRSSGKTSLLASLMLEIMPRYRVISVEDTLELPVNEMKKLNYDILSMKVRSALTGESNEVSAEEGIRASLRLGDSSLIVGEIRSDEAKALYEAMRVGALANVVAGTIHGASPYAVFDRVVNDLNVPVTSFKATDCIVVVNPIKSADGMKSQRRLLQITEVRKHWIKDPFEEAGFVDLMAYDVERDRLFATGDLINGDSEMIKSIARNVRGWAGSWDAVWDNILLRQKIKEEIVNLSESTGNLDVLEAGFCVKANGTFHEISEKIVEEIGLPSSERVFPEWKDWLNKEAKKLGI